MKMILTINKSSFPSYYEFLWEVKHSSSIKLKAHERSINVTAIDYIRIRRVLVHQAKTINHRPVNYAIKKYGYIYEIIKNYIAIK